MTEGAERHLVYGNTMGKKRFKESSGTVLISPSYCSSLLRKNSKKKNEQYDLIKNVDFFILLINFLCEYIFMCLWVFTSLLAFPAFLSCLAFDYFPFFTPLILVWPCMVDRTLKPNSAHHTLLLTGAVSTGYSPQRVWGEIWTHRSTKRGKATASGAQETQW